MWVFIFAIFVVIAVAVEPMAVMATPFDKPEYLASFDPAKGFKSAQSDLTEIFLQIAGSLEYYGSPEPYLRHMKAEHDRIESKYRRQLGHGSKAYWPVYMADEYFEQFAANWNALSPKLGLVALAKNTGHNMRDAILGTRGNGTVLVEIFNQHQTKVFDSLAGKTRDPADFDALKKELITRLYLGQTVIHDTHFTPAQRDAVDFTNGIHGPVIELFKKLDAKINPADATEIKAAITSVFIDVGRLAQSELEEAIVETALNNQLQTPSEHDGYTAEKETALNADERKVIHQPF